MKQPFADIDQRRQHCLLSAKDFLSTGAFGVIIKHC